MTFERNGQHFWACHWWPCWNVEGAYRTDILARVALAEHRERRHP